MNRALFFLSLAGATIAPAQVVKDYQPVTEQMLENPVPTTG